MIKCWQFCGRFSFKYTLKVKKFSVILKLCLVLLIRKEINFKILHSNSNCNSIRILIRRTRRIANLN